MSEHNRRPARGPIAELYEADVRLLAHASVGATAEPWRDLTAVPAWCPWCGELIQKLRCWGISSPRVEWRRPNGGHAWSYEMPAVLAGVEMQPCGHMVDSFTYAPPDRCPHGTLAALGCETCAWEDQRPPTAASQFRDTSPR